MVLLQNLSAGSQPALSWIVFPTIWCAITSRCTSSTVDMATRFQPEHEDTVIEDYG